MNIILRKSFIVLLLFTFIFQIFFPSGNIFAESTDTLVEVERVTEANTGTELVGEGNTETVNTPETGKPTTIETSAENLPVSEAENAITADTLGTTLDAWSTILPEARSAIVPEERSAWANDIQLRE